MGEVNYIVDMCHCRKGKRLFHVNMLREWYTPSSSAKRMEEVNYIVDMCDRTKGCSMLFHVNMLHEWSTPSSSALYSTEVLDGEQDTPTWTKSCETHGRSQLYC